MKKSDIELNEFETSLLEKGKREITVEDYKYNIQIFHSLLMCEK
ncbi:hypothetical protein [Bacillus cereus group sp. BfR-BA-01354]